jgi:hypothetical protein
MPSPSNLSFEEQIKLLAALPLPRNVRPTWSIRILILLIAFLLLACCARFYEALSQHPLDYLKVFGTAVWATMLTVILVYGQIRPRERSLFRLGTPALAQITSVELKRNGTRVKYRYELSPGIPMESETILYRRRDLTKGMLVIVFYDPEIPDHSSILGYSHWDITFPS